MWRQIRNKGEMIRALNQPNLCFIEERELLNEQGTRALFDSLRALLRSGKRIHVLVVERTDPK